MNAASIMGAVLRRDLLLGLRHRSALVNPLIFYFITILLFGLVLGPEARVLPGAAAAIAWVAVLFASALSLHGLFESDFEDGSLEQLLLAPVPLTLIVGGKVVAHWLVHGLPIVVAALFGAELLDLPRTAVGTLAATLLLGTPAVSLIGTVLSALTVGLRGGGLLLALLILPLCVPVLLFSVGAVMDAAQGLPVAGALYFLAALFLFAATLMPPAGAVSLRIRML